MRLNTVVNEWYQDYRKPSMFLGTVSCGGKCCIESGIPLSVCHNDGWRACAAADYDNLDLCEQYLSNPITQAIVIGGLEPFEQFGELVDFLTTLRSAKRCDDDVVIYTGYYPEEIAQQVDTLSIFKNIIIKFGRFVPNARPRFDPILGVDLSSDNQFARRLDDED